MAHCFPALHQHRQPRQPRQPHTREKSPILLSRQAPSTKFQGSLHINLQSQSGQLWRLFWNLGLCFSDFGAWLEFSMGIPNLIFTYVVLLAALSAVGHYS
jgi:hypothetical protein